MNVSKLVLILSSDFPRLSKPVTVIKCKPRKRYPLEATAIFSVLKYECVIIGKAHCDSIALNCCETRLKGREENGKTLVCDKRERAISCELCRDPYLTLMFSGLCKNTCLMESGVKVISNKIIVTLVICRLLSSPYPVA